MIAMQFTDEVNWTLSDFIVAGMLLSGAGLLFDLVIRKVNKSEYRTIVYVVIVIVFLLVWAELAVGIPNLIWNLPGLGTMSDRSFNLTSLSCTQKIPNRGSE